LGRTVYIIVYVGLGMDVKKLTKKTSKIMKTKMKPFFGSEDQTLC